MSTSPHRLRRVCAWCDADLGTRDCEPAMDGATSHGICPACAERQMRDIVSSPAAGGHGAGADAASTAGASFDAGTAATAQPGRPAPAQSTAAASTPRRSAARVVDFSAYIPAREVAAVCGISEYALDTRHRPAAWGAPRDFCFAGRVLLYRRARLVELADALSAEGFRAMAAALRARLFDLDPAGSGGTGVASSRSEISRRGAEGVQRARIPAAPAQGNRVGWLNSWEASQG